MLLLPSRKWQSQFEHEHRSLSWLQCDVCEDNRGLVDKLWCELCRKHEHSMQSLENFSRAWITHSSNHKTSNILDHVSSDQHRAAVMRWRAATAKATNQPITTYSPIASSLLTMDETVNKRMMKKFEICYLLAKEGIAFHKYPALHDLEARHGWILALHTKQKTPLRPSPTTLPRVSDNLSFAPSPQLTSTVS